MVIVEKSFPRGGTTPSDTRTEEAKANIIFGAKQQKLKKAKPKSKEQVTNDTLEDDEPLKSFSADLLNYDTIQDGMIVMGVIRAVEELYLSISLPGRMRARVTALEISNAYTKITKEFLQNAEVNTVTQYKPLKDLYTVGQIVYAKVQEIKESARGRRYINMSLKPSDVHADLQHLNIKKGFIFNGAIEEVQEHGYIIESGINNLRTFVPIEKAQKDAAHVVGQLIYLKVDKITHDTSASTCICKEVNATQLKVKNQNDPNIDYILPSNLVQFDVVKVLKDGLQGTIMNKAFTAYINEHHLGETLALPEDFEAEKQLTARILYVMPLTKLVYLTLNHQQGQQQNNDDDAEAADEAGDESKRATLKPGDIVENARAHHIGTGGVIIILNNALKGVISFRSIKANYKGNYDEDALLIKYAKKTKHKVRIIGYDVMDALYICTDDTNIVNEKIFALDDLKPGEFVQAVVKKRDTIIDGYWLQVGKIRGIIEKLFLASNTKQLEVNAKIRCRVMAINAQRNIVYLTNRPEYMSKNSKVLTSLKAAKVNANFIGTVVKCDDSIVLVKFFDNLKGVLHKQQLNGFMATETDTFFNGQTMKFRIASVNDEQIGLSLPEETFSLGEICPIEVVNSLDAGLEIKISFPGDETDAAAAESSDDEIETEDFKGLVPIRLLSDYVDLLAAKKKILLTQTDAEAVCIVKNIFSVRDVEYFRNNLTKLWQNVQINDVLRAYIKNVTGDVVELLVPIRNYNKLVKVHLKMLLMNFIGKSNVELMPEQIAYVRVLSKETTTKTLTVSAKLTDVWDGQLSNTAQYLESYLDEIASIKKSLKKQKAPIAKYTLGDKLKIIFKGVHEETNDWLYEVEKTGVLAVVKPHLTGGSKLPNEGDVQDAVVIWIDYSNELLLVSNKTVDISHISNAKELPTNLVGKSGLNAKVLLKLDNIIICSLKNRDNPLVYVPTRLHFNDFENSCGNPLKEGSFCKLAFVHKTLPIAVPESVWKLWKDAIKRKAPNTVREIEEASGPKKARFAADASEKKEIKSPKKNKNEVAATETTNKKETKATKQSKTADKKLESQAEDLLFFEDKTPNKSLSTKIAATKHEEEEPKYLSGVENFWNTDLKQLDAANKAKVESSDEDDDAQAEAPAKKKRLTATEKFKQQREEERRLRELEEKMADVHYVPETVDQFDRLILGAPNNSKHWINYMVFHLQSAEIDRAREVAQRALKTISFRDSNELLNIWIALLNLELRYGTKESFDVVLKDALNRNEPLQVYLRTVDILSNAKKIDELNHIVDIITKKFRTEEEVWRVAANALFAVGLTERAQQLLHRALAALPERLHVNTIVSFANLNQKYDKNEMAQTLLDQIVTSYPKRVDVWTQYIDMLVKSQLIDSARAVLERAVMQKIPLKKMRTIFKKYLEFEERFGDEESVQKVKLLATEFVKKSTTL